MVPVAMNLARLGAKVGQSLVAMTPEQRKAIIDALPLVGDSAKGKALANQLVGSSSPAAVEKVMSTPTAVKAVARAAVRVGISADTVFGSMAGYELDKEAARLVAQTRQALVTFENNRQDAFEDLPSTRNADVADDALILEGFVLVKNRFRLQADEQVQALIGAMKVLTSTSSTRLADVVADARRKQTALNGAF